MPSPKGRGAGPKPTMPKFKSKGGRVSQLGNIKGAGGGAAVDATGQTGMALGGQTDAQRREATNMQGSMLHDALQKSRNAKMP